MMDFTGGLPGKREDTTRGGKRLVRRSLLAGFVIACVLAVVSAAAAVVFYVKYNNLKDDPAVTAQTTKEQITERVGKLYDVPKEYPTLARVTDQDKLRSEQDFFKNANNGDYILVYPNAKLGILYRESSNKIINVGPVSTGSSNTDSNPDVEASQ